MSTQDTGDGGTAATDGELAGGMRSAGQPAGGGQLAGGQTSAGQAAEAGQGAGHRQSAGGMRSAGQSAAGGQPAEGQPLAGQAAEAQQGAGHRRSAGGDKPARQPVAGWPLVRDFIGIALAEALFFWLIAHFRHPSSMWQYGAPWALFPVACALPGLVFGGRLRLPAAARGALIGSVVLVVGCGVLALFDRMSD
jgi:hypothetical protein